MKIIEFTVEGIVPPRNVGKRSMWNNKTEIPRIIALRKMALNYSKGENIFSNDIKLEIDVYLPKKYNKPGDLDNFIKGICDALSIPKKTLANPNFIINVEFEKPENADIHPDSFEIITDDEKIIEIKATKTIEDLKESYYKVRLEGR